MNDDTLEIKLCLKYCAYYKPGKNEELECKGFTVVEKLTRRGKRIDFDKYGADFDPTTRQILMQRMCSTCDFHEQDCDFMLDRTARPCGGFVLISQLLGSGVLTIEEIE